MKKLLALLIVAAFAAPVFAADEAPKTKQVCKKDAKGKEVCKTIKVHKKHEGTPVPEKKK